MLNLIKRFPGGIKVHEHKHIAIQHPLQAAPIPARLVLPVHQHIGLDTIPTVKPGDYVLKGQRIAQAEGMVCAPIHAPTSGKITDIGLYPVPHPSGLSALCIVLDPDGKDTWIDHQPIVHIESIDPSVLRNIIRQAGIVGLGGAGFPSFIKLNPGADHPIHTLIINGCECEPYISCDHVLMRDRPHEIIAGIAVIRHALQAKQCFVAIENNKPAAINSMRDAIEQSGADIEVVPVPAVYPAGSEKQLIFQLTGQEVPSNGLPAHIGVVLHNVGTAAAMHHIVHLGQPLISRVITITGGAVLRPCNLDVLLGTSVAFLLELCGADLRRTQRLLMGGPMMGFNLQTERVPVIKTTNCIIAAAPKELNYYQNARPCIRCGACVDACPIGLLPQELYWSAQAKNFEKTQELNLFDCIECGCCAYVCPSQIPLVQYYRFAKTEIWEIEREKLKSDIARKRHESRNERLAFEKIERENKLQKKKLKPQDADSTDSHAAITAALERSQAKIKSNSEENKSTERPKEP